MDTEFDSSDLDRSEFNAHYQGLNFDSESPLFPSTMYNIESRDPMTRDEIHRSLLRHNAHCFPVEIFSEIFLYMVHADPRSRRELMLVCRHWHDIMLSTPGIHTQLRIYNWTKRRDVERFGRRWLLDVAVDLERMATGQNYWLQSYQNSGEFQATFMAAAEAASRWRSLTLLSLPPHPGKYKDLQIIHPLQHLASFKLAAKCKLGDFLEPLLKAIITTVTPRFTVMDVFHPDAALYLVQPAHLQIFSSLTTLRLICRRMQNHVDVLPSLHRLEIFEAHHLFLPIYPPGVDLPLAQTLRDLHLKSVSVQWMTGQIFPALAKCSIIFPHHADAIQSVGMPSCSVLKYDSNNLSALEHFHISTLGKLEMNCGQWRTWGGDLQLIRLHPIFAAQSLTCLHMEIKCSGRLLAYMLRLLPALEELWMGLSSPHALSTAFFLALAAGGCNANTGQSSQMIAPIGRKLRKLHLHYKRWSRGPERNALIPAFGAVVASHPSEGPNFTFRFSFGEGPTLQEWDIHEPVKKFDFGSALSRTLIGVSSPYGIVPLSRAFGDGGGVSGRRKSLTKFKYLPLPSESEYIGINGELELPINFLLSLHSLKEVRMTGLTLNRKPDTQFPLNASLFHTLKVLNVQSISSSFFAGQTFHKLERYREWTIYDGAIPVQGPLTEMPVCTRLVVPLSRLAMLKLPQIRELCLSINEEHDHIWEKQIAVNANLSGLKLLHLRYTDPTRSTIDVIKILGSLPALEALITDVNHLITPHVNVLRAFVPMNVLGPSTINQSSWKGQMSGVLCPRLENLQIEGINPTQQAELMPVLKDIVIRRAIIGSPLKIFTVYSRWGLGVAQKWQLIERDMNFMMEEVVPAQRFVFDNLT